MYVKLNSGGLKRKGTQTNATNHEFQQIKLFKKSDSPNQIFKNLQKIWGSQNYFLFLFNRSHQNSKYRLPDRVDVNFLISMF